MTNGDVIGFENIELFRTVSSRLARRLRELKARTDVNRVYHGRIHRIAGKRSPSGSKRASTPLNSIYRVPTVSQSGKWEWPWAASGHCEEVTGWVKEVATIPVWAKMTPNVGDPRDSAEAALKSGADGIALINTILSVLEVNLKTLKPMPTVEGHTVPGGYSGVAVRPIALRHVMEVARAFPETTISGMGGINTGGDAAQFMLLGSHTVQVCTGAMVQGYKVIQKMKAELQEFMDEHGFTKLTDFIGMALSSFTTHADLVARQKAAKIAKAGKGNQDDKTWQGDIASETTSLTANE